MFKPLYFLQKYCMNLGSGAVPSMMFGRLELSVNAVTK